MTWVTVMEYLCHKGPQICSTCRNHNHVLSAFVTYHRVCNKCNMTGATCGAGTAYLPDHQSSPPVVSEFHVAQSSVFCAVFCRSLFVLSFLFLLAIVLSVLLFKSSDYPFCVFKLFLSCDISSNISKMKNYLSTQIIEDKKYHDTYIHFMIIVNIKFV